jgi:osmotically-inducible protein OsmY
MEMKNETPRTNPAVVLVGFIGVGVLGCASQIQQRDEAIGRVVKRTLYDHVPVNLLHVEVSVNREVVYLAGEVDEYSHKVEAEHVAKGVEGVADVINKVQVQP